MTHHTVRRTLGLVSALGLSITVVIGLGGTAQAQPTGTAYSGEATITVATYDYCDFTTGQRRLSGQGTITAPVTMTVAAPVSDGEGGTESSPLHFTLQTDRQDFPGSFSLTSGIVATTPESGRNVALSYWTVESNPQTGEIEGTLTEDHTEEATAYNLIGVQQPLVPCRTELGSVPMVSAIAEGARLTGHLGPDDGQIQMGGSSKDGLYDIQVSVPLARRNG